MMTYCEAILKMPDGERKNLHKNYHDFHYGFPMANDDELFGRLLLEINQAGLSWETILKKEDNFRKAYDNFNIEKIALYNESDKLRLLENTGIIRNKLKIEAAIYNAQKILEIKAYFGSFENWLNLNHPQEIENWVKLFKKNFKFTGGEIVKEFLMSIGFIKGAHSPSCPIYSKVLKTKPKWHEKIV